MIDKELKDKWVIALRSGKYKQGQNRLRDKKDNFCCLGVLCDVIDPEKWKLHGRMYTWEKSFLYPTYDYELNLKFSSYSTFNDTLNYNFNKIADIIERIE